MSFVYFVGMNYGVSSYVHNTSVARMYLVCIAHSIVIIVHCILYQVSAHLIEDIPVQPTDIGRNPLICIPFVLLA